MHILYWIKLLSPILIGMTASRLYPMSNAGSSVKARPPGWVFGVMWSILYLLIGISWTSISANSKHYELFNCVFIFLNIMLFSWVMVYTKLGSKTALYYLMIILSFVGMFIWTLTIYKQNKSAFLLFPLFFWCLFASMLNLSEVNYTKS